MAWGSTLTPVAEVLPPSLDNSAFPVSNELLVSANHNPTGKKASPFKNRTEAAIDALIRFPKLKDAAAALGIHVNTLINWKAKPEFEAKLKATRKELMTAASTKAQAQAVSMLDVLVEVAQDKNASDMARVAAAKTMLDYAIRFNASEDLEARLEALERQATAYEPSIDQRAFDETRASESGEQADTD